MPQADKNKICPMYDLTPAKDSCGMFCNNWNEGPGGSMWCFVHKGNECKKHKPNIDGLHPEFEASYEACTTSVMLANARSVDASQGVETLFTLVKIMGAFAVVELIVVVGSSTYLLSESAAAGARLCHNAETEDDELLEPVMAKKGKRGVFKPTSVESAPPQPEADESAPALDASEFSADITNSSFDGGVKKGRWKPIFRPVTSPAQGMSWQDQMYNSVTNPLGSAVPLNPMSSTESMQSLSSLPSYSPLTPGDGSFAPGGSMYPQYPYMR
jgi:hypothetical protein